MLWVWGQQGTRLLLGPEPMHQWEVTATQLKTGLINAQVLNHRLQAANHTWGSTQSTKLQEERLKPPCVSWEVAANCIHDTSSRKRSVQPLHTETWLSSTSLINRKTNKQTTTKKQQINLWSCFLMWRMIRIRFMNSFCYMIRYSVQILSSSLSLSCRLQT